MLPSPQSRTCKPATASCPPPPRLRPLPLSQPVLYEVLSVTRLSEAALPELSALREQASVACQEAVSPYLENQTEHPTYRAQFLSPTQTSWKAGDRTLLCLLTSSDSTELTAAATR